MPTMGRDFSNSEEMDLIEDDNKVPDVVLFNGRICRLQPMETEETENIETKNLPKVEIVTTVAVKIAKEKKKSPPRRNRSSSRSSSSLSRSQTPPRAQGAPKRSRPSIEREVYTGEIARIVDKNNFGFLKMDPNQKGCPYEEMFFHRKTIAGSWKIEDLGKGDKVQVRYEIAKGRPQAWDVAIVGTAEDTPSPSPDRGWVDGFVSRLVLEKQFGYIAPKDDIGYPTVWFHNSFIRNRVSIRQLKVKDKVKFLWEKDPKHNGRVRAKDVYITTRNAKERKRVFSPARSRSFSRSRSRTRGKSRRGNDRYRPRTRSPRR